MKILCVIQAAQLDFSVANTQCKGGFGVDGWAVDDGYRLALMGDHDADVGSMFAQLRRRVRAAIGRQYLEHSRHRDGWIMRGMEVEGRLVWRDELPGYDVVVDGRRLSWEEFGATLEPFEGWAFRLSMHDVDTAG